MRLRATLQIETVRYRWIDPALLSVRARSVPICAAQKKTRSRDWGAFREWVATNRCPPNLASKQTFMRPAANFCFPRISAKAWTRNPCNRQRRRPHITLGLSLAAYPARLRVSQGRTALRSVAHSAMRPHRGAAPGIPVCPPREHVPPRPLRRIALWSVLRGKTIPPLHPSSASGRAVCLLGSGNPTVKTHTHMSMEAYPPDGSQISPRQGSQNFSARAGLWRRAVPSVSARVCRELHAENFCARQAGGCAVPDPGRFGNQAFGHAPTLTWWLHNRTLETRHGLRHRKHLRDH